MLIVHKIIDALSGVQRKKYSLLKVPGLSQQVCKTVAERLTAAEKFDFGPVPLERDPRMDGAWIIPKLTADEEEFWRLGLLPLPAPLCWYELELGGTRSGLLIEERGARWAVQRVDFVSRHIAYDGVTRVTDREEVGSKDGIRVRLVGAQETLDWFERHSEDTPQISPKQIAEDMVLALYLTLMINSRTTERQPALIPRALNASRSARGRTPLADHLIVRIVPEQFRAEALAEGQRHHRPPRLHWRRSHARHYDRRVPSAVWSEALEHDGRKGWWVTVIARQLVGRAELGEVSHEYFIQGKEAKRD